MTATPVMSTGKLILKAVPNADTEEKIIDLIARGSQNASREKLKAMVRKAPVVLSQHVPEKTGRTMAARIEKLGATAIFMPDPPAAAGETVQQEGTSPEKRRPPAKPHPPQFVYQHPGKSWKLTAFHQLETVNKELWLILSLFVIVGIMNYLVVGHRLMLGLYTLPTITSAYLYGRRHATLTALASILLVSLVVYNNPSLFSTDVPSDTFGGRWYDIISWGAILLITAYAMGTLYENVKARINELQSTYHGLIVILRHFISKDKYTENHCYRVSIYATKIAACLGLATRQVEDIRAAALLHDLGKLDISRELLYKASQFTRNEFEDMKKHVDKGVEILRGVDTPLNRILPIILSHHERHDGTGYYEASDNEIPIESRVISVADVYDALSSDRPYRKAMSPYEARDQILKGAGTQFDPNVVNAFFKAFEKGEIDVPQVVV